MLGEKVAVTLEAIVTLVEAMLVASEASDAPIC
jgi:hypothetical protein